MSLTKHQQNQKTTIEKYQGKILYDKKYKKKFTFDASCDWPILFEDPERFEIVGEDIHQLHILTSEEIEKGRSKAYKYLF